MKYVVIFFIILFAVAYLQTSVFALVDEEIYSQIQFNNFVPRGARAIALGGAFIGLADDATAVETNPAGLATIATPEILTEFQYINYSVTRLYNYRKRLYQAAEIFEKDFNDSVIGSPFFGIIYPYKKITLGKTPLVFSVYGEQWLNYKSSYRTSENLSITSSGNDGYPISVWPTDASIELTGSNFGIGVAVELFNGFFFGVSPKWSVLKIKSSTSHFSFSYFVRHDDYIEGVTDFSYENLLTKTLIDDSDSTFSMNMGIIWRLHPKISLGAVYKIGPKFTMKLVQGGNYYYDLTVNIPDSVGVGIAVQPNKFLTITVDALYISYKDLLENFTLIQPYGMSVLWYPSIKENFSVNNLIEPHIGTEYILPVGKRLIALRLGGYYEPGHNIHFKGTTGNQASDFIEKLLFTEGNDQIHLTGGFGLIFNEHFQLDTAANIAKEKKLFSISIKYLF